MDTQQQQYPTPIQKPKYANNSSIEEFEPLSFTKFYEMATVSPNTPVNGWQQNSGKPDRYGYESKGSKVKPFTAAYTSTSKRHLRQTVTPSTTHPYRYNYDSAVNRTD